VLSPERIVIGGGVMQRAGLLADVQREVAALLNGYLGETTSITLPELDGRAGVLGAIALAESADA
jgi:predicted NBD/HSP70 family sugar kinase